jgi:hypothetical protein
VRKSVQPNSRQKNRKSPSRILIVNGSSRSAKACPGEMSKTLSTSYDRKKIVEKSRGFEVEVLDLSRLTSEYGRVIYPCKACVSTAQTTLPLAVLMLPKPRARAIGRLDGGDLSKMGHSARRDDHLPR